MEQPVTDLKNNVRPAPRLSELVNAQGSIIYRKLYTSNMVIIHKEEIEQFLNGRELNDTTVWEVIQAFENAQ